MQPAAHGDAASMSSHLGGQAREGWLGKQLQSASPFQTVYVTVPNTNGIAPATFSPNTVQPRDVATGFWQLRLSAPVTTLLVLSNLAGVTTGSRFTLGYAVANASGVVGPTVTSTKTVVGSAGGVQVGVTWDTRTDVDLHVQEPSGNEVYYGATTSSTGGQLDVDSNPACSIDGKNNENIRWSPTAPNGTYIVRVDYWSACSVTGATTFAVVVNNGGQISRFTGSFSANQADAGGRGSGREITRFNHTTGISPFSMVPVYVEQLSLPNPFKMMMSRDRDQNQR